MRSNKKLRSILKELRHTPFASPDPVFKRNARIRLLNQIAMEEKNARRLSLSFLNLPQFFFKAVPKYAVVVLVLFITIVPTTVLAAQESKPSQVLYPLKRASEKVILAITPVKSWKTQLALGIANRRLDEYEQLKKEGKEEFVPQAIKDYKKSVEDIKISGNLKDEEIEKTLSPHKKTIQELREIQGRQDQEEIKSKKKEEDNNLNQDQNKRIELKEGGKDLKQVAPKVQPSNPQLRNSGPPKPQASNSQSPNSDSLNNKTPQSNGDKNKAEVKGDNSAKQQDQQQNKDKDANPQKEKSSK